MYFSFLMAVQPNAAPKKNSTFNSHSEIAAAIMPDFQLQFFKAVTIVNIIFRSNIFIAPLEIIEKRPKGFISKAGHHFVRLYYI